MRLHWNTERCIVAHPAEALPARLEELERLLEQRTAELREARKELDDFTYSVSHDLRAPMRHINGYATIILEDYGSSLDPKCRQHFETVLAGANKVSAMLEDLTKFSQLARQELCLKEMVLDTLLQDVVRSITKEASGRDIEWKIGKLPQIHADAAMMKQVFLNLLKNAVKFTQPRDHAVIEVGTVRDNGEPTIFVRDNGAGFDMKYTDKLFTVFQRLHGNQGIEGRGMGLAIAKRIVSKHGGRIWAEATPDKGATFYFTLSNSQPKEREA
jgi:light-regulated signal transduction histidine kinase (bacteriophytochrome)